MFFKILLLNLLRKIIRADIENVKFIKSKLIHLIFKHSSKIRMYPYKSLTRRHIHYQFAFYYYCFDQASVNDFMVCRFF